MKEHILSIVWLTPLVGMFILFLLPKEAKNLIRLVARRDVETNNGMDYPGIAMLQRVSAFFLGYQLFEKA